MGCRFISSASLSPSLRPWKSTLTFPIFPRQTHLSQDVLIAPWRHCMLFYLRCVHLLFVPTWNTSFSPLPVQIHLATLLHSLHPAPLQGSLFSPPQLAEPPLTLSSETLLAWFMPGHPASLPPFLLHTWIPTFPRLLAGKWAM